MSLDTLFYLAILIYSIIAHEVAHGYAAYLFGDKTALHAGRLTLNPVPHIDAFGSILLPVLSAFSLGGAIIGWAKPVPYNPYNLKNSRLGETVVSAAGVLTNIFLAVVFAGMYRLLSSSIAAPALEIIALTVVINLSLAFFNLLPIPPFDGMRIITSLFPIIGRKINRYVDNMGTVFLIAALFAAMWLWSFVYPIVTIVANTFLGGNVL